MTEDYRRLERELDELRQTKRFAQLVDRYLHRLATLTGIQLSPRGLRIVLAKEEELTQGSQETLVTHIQDSGIDYTPEDLQTYLLQQARTATTPKVMRTIENLGISRKIPKQAARDLFCERIEAGLVGKEF